MTPVLAASTRMVMGDEDAEVVDGKDVMVVITSYSASAKSTMKMPPW